MARSFRTKPLRYKTATNAVALVSKLRIIERRPHPGDTHSISAKDIRLVLSVCPPEYIAGLRMIELRPRHDSNVGSPYGFYEGAEKRIVLYSLPMNWSFDFQISVKDRQSFTSSAASVMQTKDSTDIVWNKKEDRALWFFKDVLLHELAHHYCHQNRYRRKPASIHHEELLADLHGSRIWTRIVSTIRRH